jgi:hypothetical protein
MKTTNRNCKLNQKPGKWICTSLWFKNNGCEVLIMVHFIWEVKGFRKPIKWVPFQYSETSIHHFWRQGEKQSMQENSCGKGFTNTLKRKKLTLYIFFTYACKHNKQIKATLKYPCPNHFLQRNLLMLIV